MGVPPRGNHVPLLEEVANDDKALANPPAMTDEDIRGSFLLMSQEFTTQSQDITNKYKSMNYRANREVAFEEQTC